MLNNPTPTQLTRAAELAPRVAEIAGFATDTHPGYWPMWGALGEDNMKPLIMGFAVGGERVCTLDPRAFQAVALALPPDTFIRPLDETRRVCARIQMKAGNLDEFPIFERWLLTPAGMLEFYEALVDMEGSGG